MDPKLAPITVSERQPKLNKLLRTELACTATYEQALTHVNDPAARAALEHNRKSHAVRVVMLAQHVRANGGIPSSSAGPWGVFTKLFEGAASLVSEQAVLDAIRAGEKQTTSTYKAMVDRAIQEDAVETHVIREGMLAQLDAERRMGQIMS